MSSSVGERRSMRSTRGQVRRERHMAERWEYLARNLKKVAGPALENDFNKLGDFAAVAKDYAIFKHRARGSEPELPVPGREQRLDPAGGDAESVFRQRLGND